MKLDVPFFANTPDNTHCFQAALRMVLKNFLPDRDYSWEKLDKMTAKKENQWTWPLSGILELQSLGFEVVNIEKFDYDRFINKGNDYLYDTFDKEVAQAQIEHSDIDQEQELSKAFINRINTERRAPTIEGIVNLTEQGYLVICNLNARKLHQQDGYAGHFAVITGYQQDHLILHDPGLPPHKNLTVSKEVFEQAWCYPNEYAKNIIAFRYSAD